MFHVDHGRVPHSQLTRIQWVASCKLLLGPGPPPVRKMGIKGRYKRVSGFGGAVAAKADSHVLVWMIEPDHAPNLFAFAHEPLGRRRRGSLRSAFGRLKD